MDVRIQTRQDSPNDTSQRSRGLCAHTTSPAASSLCGTVEIAAENTSLFPSLSSSSGGPSPHRTPPVRPPVGRLIDTPVGLRPVLSTLVTSGSVLGSPYTRSSAVVMSWRRRTVVVAVAPPQSPPPGLPFVVADAPAAPQDRGVRTRHYTTQSERMMVVVLLRWSWRVWCPWSALASCALRRWRRRLWTNGEQVHPSREASPVPSPPPRHHRPTIQWPVRQ